MNSKELSKGVVMRILAVLTFLFASSVQASQATIVGMYDSCEYLTSGVFIDKGVLPDDVALSVTAEFELLTRGASFADTVIRGKQQLGQYGITDVEVKQTGSIGCSSRLTGYFVQAVGNYCDERLVSAEIRVDGELFSKQDAPTISFQDFVDRSTARLRAAGIWDQPRVTVRSQGTCG